MKKLKIIPKEEDKLPTLSEFTKNIKPGLLSNLDDNGLYEAFQIVVIDFTKMIVKKALEQAAKKARIIEKWDDKEGEYYDAVDKRSIINAYPLENIK